jgi:hypothetical protein
MNPKLLLCLAFVLSGLPGHLCRAAIIYPRAPEGGQQMVYDFANFFAQKNLPPFKGLKIENLTITAPYQSYSAGTNLVAGKLLSAAVLGRDGGWQYLLIRGANAVGLARLKADEKTGKALKCYELDSGLVNERLVALHIAEHLPEVKNQDYELRSLDMPWIFFSAMWLHGKSDDIIIPLPDRWGRWNGYQPYSESQMVKVLQPIAEKQSKKKWLPGMVD